MRMACEDLADNLKGKFYLGDLDINEGMLPIQKMDNKSLSNMT
jgi:hypothetical protein